MTQEIIKSPEQLEIEHIALEKQIALEEVATRNCLVNVVAGSHAYGTNIEGSDWDERSIFVDDIERIILPFSKIEQVTYRQDDKVAFELSKYMPLLLEQNPNVIELLWTENKDVLFKSELGQLLIYNRSNFLTSRVKDSYVGYAMGQLKRIKGHNKWINSPQPEEEPVQIDFSSVVWNYSGNKEYNKKVPTTGYIAISIGSNNYSLWKAEKLGLPSTKSWIDNKGNPYTMSKNDFDILNKDNIPPDLIAKINVDVYEHAHINWKSYWQWKKNRNEKRSRMEEKFGYDTKHAMHLIRLLRSGVDILEKGIVPVKRDDFQYLLDIRFGKYTYDEIVTESEKLSKKVEELSKKTSLPSEANLQLAKNVMLEIYSKQWNMSIHNVKKIKP